MLSASRAAHGGPSTVEGSTASFIVVAVFSLVPVGSRAISTLSVRQCRLQSDAASTAPRVSSRTSTSTVSTSPERDSRAVAEQSSGDAQSSPSQRRERSSTGPGYSPGPAVPSTTGGASTAGTDVAGTSSSDGSTVDRMPSAVVTVSP
jgi:hypothetical protein